MKKIFSILILSVSIALPGLLKAQEQTAGTHYNLIIGTYTQPGKSEGIYVYDFNDATGEVKYKSVAKGVENPSFLAISKNRKFVYAVNELGGEKKGGVSAFAFDAPSGQLTFINKQNSEGDHPCYISVDKKSKNVIVGNYTGGNLSVLNILPKGGLSPAVQTIQHVGTSVNKERQEKAHMHCTILSPDEKYVFTSDLGTDEVTSYKYSPWNVQTPLAQASVTKVLAGSGPRHLAFHPNGKWAYLVQELNASVNAYDCKNGKLMLKQTISMVADNFKGKVGAADIHVSPDGKFLYASNRGDANDIAIYSIDKIGKLVFVGSQSTLGKTPRNFAIDPSGKFLLVANQETDDIYVFKRDLATGLLTQTENKINVGAPVFLNFVSTKK
ncbi:MAG: lactonase family protein [Daejeonella sp.]|nr:lactonase family protein [Daejeonella sp.]